MNEEEQLRLYFESELGLETAGAHTFEALRMELVSYINRLIQEDFAKLVRLLYRVDVSEARLKYLLKQHEDEDAGNLIAGLMIERQAQKIKTRSQFRQENENKSGEERW